MFVHRCQAQEEPLSLVGSTPSLNPSNAAVQSTPALQTGTAFQNQGVPQNNALNQNNSASRPKPSLFIKQPSVQWLPQPLYGVPQPPIAHPPQVAPQQLNLIGSSPGETKLRFASDLKDGNSTVDPIDSGLAGTAVSPNLNKPSQSANDFLPLSVLAVPGAVTPAPPNSGATSSSLLDTAQPNNTNTTDANPASAPGVHSASNANKSTLPTFFLPPSQPVQLDCYGQAVPYSGSDFSCPPTSNAPADPLTESLIYRGKTPVVTQRPWVELGRPLYTSGIYPPASSFFFGETNLLQPHFWVYGDYRTGVGVNENQNGAARSWARRLNLDMDLQFTATERLHAFMGPLDRNNDVSRLDFSDSQNIEYVNRADIRFDTLFFEGDLGAIIGGREGTYSPFDLPFTVGLMPLVYQNGIWMEDAAIGAAFAIPAQHSTLLDWPNYEISFFALTDQLTTDAFPGDNNAAEAFGTAWFIEAYDGYIEADYAFVHDDVGGHRSYHNAAIAFTRRYFYRVSNSIRFITNFDQALPKDQRTADGYLVLLENSLITSNANFFVPYANFFYGSGKPQSVARAGVAGGILRNTGINFETDLLTDYPTLDATANNTYGAAFGLNILGNNFSHQLVLELAALAGTGSDNFRNAPGDQYAAGVRYQKPLSHRWIFRADSMYGWLRDTEDIYGNRIEFRWKF